MDWPLLASLVDAERRQVLASARRRIFSRGEVVFHEGDPADSMHLIASGRLAVKVSTPSGEAATLNILTPGDFFGELTLLRQGEQQRRSATVQCLEASETLSLSAPSFHALCDKHPTVERLLSVLLAKRVEELSERLLEALYVGLDRRVYRRLIELCAIYCADDAAMMIPLTQDQLADLVGGRRPSVNQVLNKLAAQGLVSLGRGRIEVFDAAALRRRAGS